MWLGETQFSSGLSEKRKFLTGARNRARDSSTRTVVIIPIGGMILGKTGVQSAAGMILERENRSTVQKTYPRATFSNINPTWIFLGSTPDLRVERLNCAAGWGSSN